MGWDDMGWECCIVALVQWRDLTKALPVQSSHIISSSCGRQSRNRDWIVDGDCFPCYSQALWTLMQNSGSVLSISQLLSTFSLAHLALPSL